MKLGYHTNGLAHHNAMEALELLKDIGYQSVALAVDHGLLNPFDERYGIQLQQVKHFLSSNRLSNCIETNPRYLLDPREPFAPSLMDSEPKRVQKRVAFYEHCIDAAVELNSECVTICSGIKPAEVNFPDAMERLAKHLKPILKYAESRNVDIGFEANSEMLIDTTGRFERLLHLVDSPRLKMTLDIGQLFCKSEIPIGGYIEKWEHHLVNVHIKDGVAGQPQQLMFGDGQMYFPPVIDTLFQIGYSGGIHIELENHSLTASDAIETAYQFMAPIIVNSRSKKLE